MAERKEVWAVSPRGEGKKDWWTRAGTAFENKDGSWTLMLDVLPTNGKLIMRDEQQREERAEPPPRRAPPREPRRDASKDYDDYSGADDDAIPF
jgi:hypothetical protein